MSKTVLSAGAHVGVDAATGLPHGHRPTLIQRTQIMLSPSRGLRTSVMLGAVLSVVSCDQSRATAPRPTLASQSVSSVPALGSFFAYVMNSFSNNVSVIATATNTVVGTVGVGSGQLYVAITPDGAFAYVTIAGSSTVSVIATATNAVVATVAVGLFPQGLAITPDGEFVYVVNSGSNTVSVIAIATSTVVATVAVATHPLNLAITPDGAFAYVTHAFGLNQISVIATATNTVVAAIAVQAQEVAITPNGAFAYATTTSNTVSVISTATNTVVGAVPVGFDPRGLAITPNGAFVYVTNTGGGSVSVIATATNTVIASVGVGTSPIDVAITLDGTIAYVTNAGSNTVSAVTTATNTVLATIAVGSGPRGVAITPAIAPPPPPVFTIDLQPEDPNNVVRLTSLRTEVAILSSASFDASKIDPAPCRLSGGAEGIRPLLGLTRILDFGRDGDLDLLLTFSTPTLVRSGNLSRTTTSMTLKCGTLSDNDFVRPT